MGLVELGDGLVDYLVYFFGIVFVFFTFFLFFPLFFFFSLFGGRWCGVGAVLERVILRVGQWRMPRGILVAERGSLSDVWFVDLKYSNLFTIVTGFVPLVVRWVSYGLGWVGDVIAGGAGGTRGAGVGNSFLSPRLVTSISICIVRAMVVL